MFHYESYSFANTPNGQLRDGYSSWDEMGSCPPPVYQDPGNPNDEDTCTNGNPFRIYDGNVMRRAVDLKIAGALSTQFSWTRHQNTVTRGDGQAYFGVAGCWRHNWQYDLVPLARASGNPDLELILPAGDVKLFSPQPDGKTWLPPASVDTRIAANTAGFLVTMRDGTTHKFFKKSTTGGAVRYDMEESTDVHGLVTHLTYDAAGRLLQVKEPAGRTISLSYRDVTFQRGVTEKLATVTAAPKAGQWLEFTAPASSSGAGYSHLRLLTAHGAPLSVAEVEFYAPNATKRLTGVATGTADVAAPAFDGSSSTVFRGAREAVNVCGLSLPTPSPVTRIRILAAPGHENEMTGVVVEGLRNESAVRRVVDRALGSDGQSVSYEYSTLADPVSKREFVALASVAYADGTRARYDYDFVTAAKRPYLVQADDPRNPERAKRIKYEYRDTPGMIHREINPATGGVYAALELDPTDPEKRIVHYSDLRSKSFVFPAAAGGRSTQSTDSLGRVKRREFDNGQGRLVAATDAKGRRAEVGYTAAGHISSSKRDGVTRQTREYDSRGLVTKLADRDGKAVSLERDARGRLSRVFTPDGATREFAYDDLGRPTSFKQRDGGVHRFTYDTRGLKTAWTTPKGATIRYGYDARDRVISITDEAGRVTRRELDDRGLVTKLIQPDGTKRSFAYDTYGRKISEADASGGTSKFAYDELSRLVRQEDSLSRVTTYDYTELPQGCGSCTLVDHPSRIVNPDGSVTKFLYDSEGRLLARTVAADTSAQATTTYTYDTEDHLLSATDPLGHTTRYTYDDEGNRLTQTDPLGRTIRWTYDDHRNVLTATAPDGGVTKNTYDNLDRLTRTVDAAGNSTRYDYDELGNIVTLTDATGAKTRYTYDGRCRTAQIYSDGKKQTWTYDALGRVVKTVSPDDVETITTYDSGNRVTATVDSTGRKFAFTYDDLGRRTAATDPLSRTTRWTYDARGNILTTTRPDGVVTSKTYDAQNHVLTETDAAGYTTRYVYDSAGNPIALTDANNHTYRFAYDALHRKTAMIYPDDSKETWTYDLAGNLVAYGTRAGQIKTTAYNAANQPVSDTWSPAGAASDVRYIYNRFGQLSELSTLNAQHSTQTQLTYTYDDLGRLASETSDLSALAPGLKPDTVGYRYDELGRRSRLDYPDNTKVSYTYDARRRVTSIDPNGGGRTRLATYRYDNFSRIAQLDRDNGVATRYTYDMAGQLTDIIHANGANVLAALRYRLDVIGRSTAQTREDGITENYSYDLTSQLTSVDYGTGRSETFTYDPLGNRTQTKLSALSSQPSTTTYTTNDLNQYTKVNGVAFTYDANGNLVSDGVQAYCYDAWNRLAGVETATTKTEFVYDARNRCVFRRQFSKAAQGQWIANNDDSRVLVYDPAWNLLVERSPDGRAVGTYVHGARADEILCVTLMRHTVYPLADRLNSTIALVDENTSLISKLRYDAFGTPRASIGQEPTCRLLFSGREWLRGIALNEHRYRYYSPGLGRWVSPDPIRFEALDANINRYVLNNPVNLTDGSGLNPGTAKYCPIVCQSGEQRREDAKLTETITENHGAGESDLEYELTTERKVGFETGFEKDKLGLSIKGSFEWTSTQSITRTFKVSAGYRGWIYIIVNCTCNSTRTGWNCTDGGMGFKQESM